MDAKKTLEPVLLDENIIEGIEYKVFAFIYQTLFKPLIDAFGIKPKSLQNTQSDLLKAIQRDQVRYRDGAFYGNFNSVISSELNKIGATFDKSRKAFEINFYKLPYKLRVEINNFYDTLRTKNIQALETLNKIDLLDEMKELDLEGYYQEAIKDLDMSFTTNINDLINVKADLSKWQKRKVRKEYTNNMKVYVKDFLEQEIREMRHVIEENLFAGYRAENLIPFLQERYGVSENKAKFLAKQETSLLQAKYTEARYNDANITEFIWGRSTSKNKRHEHEELYGKKFSFKNPPIIDKRTGQKGLPGEAFNCGCKILPVIPS